MTQVAHDATEPTALVERDGVRFHLLGTAHVSRRSAEAVAAAVAGGDYDAIAIELDPARKQALTEPNSFEKLDLLAVIRAGKVGMVAAQLALAAYQRRIAEQFGIEPGAEMREAITGAAARGLPLLLIDREAGLTLKRCSAALGFWQRMNLLSGLGLGLLSSEEISEAEIEKLKTGSMLHATFSEFATETPALYGALIDERDQYMAAKLRQAAAAGGHRKVLAVVGAGHLAGIQRYLTADADPQATVQALDQQPPPSIWPKLIGYGLLAVLIGGLLLGFSRGFDVGTELLGLYLMLTAGGALIGATLAGAHPLSAIAGAVSAPLTVLHPLLAAGMFSAGTETWLRKPTVADLSRLKDDVTTAGGWWRNRATRILLVFFLTNLGTAIGVWTTSFEFVRRLS
ncbi:MAG: TraB/GumN family protein [Xanthomonadales bacterium]|jgi:pheromone shutdown-related protein TraB|nr:TraB/GumN family protein [Xanthomonadales bacterium]